MWMCVYIVLLYCTRITRPEFSNSENSNLPSLESSVENCSWNSEVYEYEQIYQILIISSNFFFFFQIKTYLNCCRDDLKYLLGTVHVWGVKNKINKLYTVWYIYSTFIFVEEITIKCMTVNRKKYHNEKIQKIWPPSCPCPQSFSKDV